MKPLNVHLFMIVMSFALFHVLIFVLFESAVAEGTQVKGKITAFRGKDITISIPQNAHPVIGDRVTVSFMAGDDSIPYGVWKISSINSNGTVEAVPVGEVEQPTINLDAYITATGKTAAPEKEPKETMTADERFNVATKLLEGNKSQEDVDRAIALIKQGVDEGHPSSLRGYGWIYELGKFGFPRNYKKAAKWYQKASDAGDANAAWLLGVMYRKGRGVSQDYAKAAELFKKSCDAGSASGCTNLGWMYQTGKGVGQNYNQAFELYKKGCDKGNAQGCSNLGYLYKSGKGVHQDYARAVELYKKGCDNGDALGCSNLGVMYKNGFGVSKDLQRAMELYEYACKKNEARGCTNLGWSYYTGEGVQENKNKGREFLEKGCSMGSEWGCNKLQELK